MPPMYVFTSLNASLIIGHFAAVTRTAERSEVRSSLFSLHLASPPLQTSH